MSSVYIYVSLSPEVIINVFKNDFAALRHMCSESAPCDEDMICAIDNTTKTTGYRNSNSNFPQPPMRLCLCDEAKGLMEDTKDNSCNGMSKNSYSFIKYKSPYMNRTHTTLFRHVTRIKCEK